LADSCVSFAADQSFKGCAFTDDEDSGASLAVRLWPERPIVMEQERCPS
jgi:hypothetical protein